MIQANELRKDNWILYKEIPTVVFGVNGVDEKYLDPDGDIYDLKDCYPIPLTEEILLKCPEFFISFFDSNNYYLRNHDSQFHLRYNENIGRFVFRGLGMSVVYVDTLHRLQNLVYVNTGKELEVKL